MGISRKFWSRHVFVMYFWKLLGFLFLNKFDNLLNIESNYYLRSYIKKYYCKLS